MSKLHGKLLEYAVLIIQTVSVSLKEKYKIATYNEDKHLQTQVSIN